MSRKTWRDLARQQPLPTTMSPPGANTSLQQLSGQVPGLQRLLQQRQTLEKQMRLLGGQADGAGASRVYPVASAAERRAEQAEWEQRRAQQQGNSATSTPAQQWQQQRDSQLEQAKAQASGQQQAHLSLLQRLDQRVDQARSNALSRLQQQRSESLREPLLRPLTDRLNNAFNDTDSAATTTTLQHFDDRYARRQQRLLGVEAGALEQLEQRRQQALERRLEERREARRNERQQSLLQQRAAERRSQRPQLSTD